MDNKENILTYGTDVFYSQVSGNEEYWTGFVYDIGKSNVKLIKYEAK